MRETVPAAAGESTWTTLDGVLVPVTALLKRWRDDRPDGAGARRKEEVAAVRKRMGAAARAPAGDETVALAKELRALRPLVLEAFAGVRACSGCGRGRPEPHGHWNGGFCCGGATGGVFDDDEVAALALSGTRPRDLRPPSGDHAGCAFRGPEGCSLDAVDRPNLCVRFACRELEAELRASGEWTRVRALTRRLEQTFARFVKARDDQGA
jgi:hypothetical protein